ncbi:MAG: hypothetical protein JKY46_01060 [Robiginitomaculum sp.]|nr:hypothetical protein [Robiginitomaculum sp.]
MSNLFPSRIVFAPLISIMLFACTTKVEISYVEILKTDVISDNFQIVATQESIRRAEKERATHDSGYYFVKLESKISLEKIVRKKQMAFLYYHLQSCDKTRQQPVLYSAPVYINMQFDLRNSNEFYYYAPVSYNYKNDIRRYQGMQNKTNLIFPDDICISLGAGNMAGQILTTNSVRIELQ